MKPASKITAQIGMEQKPTPPKDSGIEDHNFIILSRTITVEYKTRTTGVTTHTVVVKATSPYVTHYDGRYHERDGADLKVKSPHKKVDLGEIVHGLRKFFVEFEHPLQKDKTETLIMEVTWVHKQQAEHPEAAMVILCPTEFLKFIVHPPRGERLSNADKIVYLHPGAHKPQSIIEYISTDNHLTWDIPGPKLLLYYQLKWKWV